MIGVIFESFLARMITKIPSIMNAAWLVARCVAALEPVWIQARASHLGEPYIVCIGTKYCKTLHYETSHGFRMDQSILKHDWRDLKQT